METGNIYDNLKKLEIALDGGLSLGLGNYVICSKKEVLSHIAAIKCSIPDEVMQAEPQIIHSGKNSVFSHIERLIMIVASGFCLFDSFVVLPRNKMCEIIDNIYADMPVNVQIAKQILKS